MPKQKFRHEMGVIVPDDAYSDEMAADRLSFLKKVMTATTLQQFCHLNKMKMIKRKFTLRAPEAGAVGPLFIGNFKIEYDDAAKAQPSALPIVEGDFTKEVDEEKSTG